MWRVIWILGWSEATLCQSQFASYECHLLAQSHSRQKFAYPEREIKIKHTAVWLMTNCMSHHPWCVTTAFKVMMYVCMHVHVPKTMGEAILLPVYLRLITHPASSFSQSLSLWTWPGEHGLLNMCALVPWTPATSVCEIVHVLTNTQQNKSKSSSWKQLLLLTSG